MGTRIHPAANPFKSSSEKTDGIYDSDKPIGRSSFAESMFGENFKINEKRSDKSMKSVTSSQREQGLDLLNSYLAKAKDKRDLAYRNALKLERKELARIQKKVVNIEEQ